MDDSNIRDCSADVLLLVENTRQQNNKIFFYRYLTKSIQYQIIDDSYLQKHENIIRDGDRLIKENEELMEDIKSAYEIQKQQIMIDRLEKKVEKMRIKIAKHSSKGAQLRSASTPSNSSVHSSMYQDDHLPFTQIYPMSTSGCATLPSSEW